MSAHEKALDRKKVDKKVNNLVKGNEGRVDDKQKKPKLRYKFNKYKGAKNNDSQQD